MKVHEGELTRQYINPLQQQKDCQSKSSGKICDFGKRIIDISFSIELKIANAKTKCIETKMLLPAFLRGSVLGLGRNESFEGKEEKPKQGISSGALSPIKWFKLPHEKQA